MFSVHGSWSSWSSWPNCNKPCNGGNKTRERMCNNPEPAFGGQNCEGPITETKPCNLDSCPGIQLFVRWGWIWFYMKAKLWFSLHARSQEGDSKKTVWKYLLSIVCWVIFTPSRTLKNLDEPVARGLASHQKALGSLPCELSLLLGLVVLWGVFHGLYGFPPCTKPNLSRDTFRPVQRTRMKSASADMAFPVNN